MAACNSGLSMGSAGTVQAGGGRKNDTAETAPHSQKCVLLFLFSL
jgi:hypothetical protein